MTDSANAPKLTIDGISTFLILVAGSILREHYQVPQKLRSPNIPIVSILESSVQVVSTERDSIQFPLPAKSEADLAVVQFLMLHLKALIENEDLIAFATFNI